MALYPTIGANGQTTAQFELERSDRPFAICVPNSLTASELRVQFAASSGGMMGDLQRPDGSGLPFTAFSGATGSLQAFCVVPHVPTPWVRLYTPVTQTAVRTFTILPVAR